MPEDMLARLWTPGVVHDRAPAVQCEVRQHSPRSVSQHELLPVRAACLSSPL